MLLWLICGCCLNWMSFCVFFQFGPINYSTNYKFKLWILRIRHVVGLTLHYTAYHFPVCVCGGVIHNAHWFLPLVSWFQTRTLPVAPPPAPAPAPAPPPPLVNYYLAVFVEQSKNQKLKLKAIRKWLVQHINLPRATCNLNVSFSINCHNTERSCWDIKNSAYNCILMKLYIQLVLQKLNKTGIPLMQANVEEKSKTYKQLPEQILFI